MQQVQQAPIPHIPHIQIHKINIPTATNIAINIPANSFTRLFQPSF